MKTRAEIDTTVHRIVVDHLNCDPAQATPDKTLDDLGADSLDKVELVMALEDEFGIHITDETAETISTVKDMGDTVETCLAH